MLLVVVFVIRRRGSVVQVLSPPVATLHANPLYDPAPDPLEVPRGPGPDLIASPTTQHTGAHPVASAPILYAVAWDRGAGHIRETPAHFDAGDGRAVYATWSLQASRGLETGRGVDQRQMVLAGATETAVDDGDGESGWDSLYQRPKGRR